MLLKSSLRIPLNAKSLLRCRTCTQRLLEASATAVTGGDADAASVTPEQRAAALRCSHCLALMLEVVKHGQVGRGDVCDMSH